jgi:hypothetical protein
MYQYPSIDSSSKAPQLPCFAFFKYDGSGLRFEWGRKRGWSKFGTRHRLFDHTDSDFGCAIEIFRSKYAGALEKVILDSKNYRNAEKVTAFCEFLGPNSFAGQHVSTDIKDIILFDIHVHKKGILGPKEFLDNFGHLSIAKLVYEGNLNQTFIDNVRNGKHDVNEGVVCKWGSGHKLGMCKIKTLAYLEKLKNRFENWKEFWE